MSMDTDPLKTTTQELHRFWFLISTEQQWYDIIRECRSWFGKSWRGQGKIRRKLKTFKSRPLEVWFDVPDIRFATWISVKFSIQVQSNAKKESGK